MHDTDILCSRDILVSCGAWPRGPTQDSVKRERIYRPNKTFWHIRRRTVDYKYVIYPAEVPEVSVKVQQAYFCGREVASPIILGLLPICPFRHRS